MMTIPRLPLADGPSHAPTLVCLPGAMCSPQVYAGAARLSGLPALALAWLEDEGPHDLDAIATRVCEALHDLPRVILVGHSLGTPIAVLAACQMWQRGGSQITGLVLANSGANTHGHGDIDSLIRRIDIEWGEAFWDAFVSRCFGTLPDAPLLQAVRDYPARLRKAAVIEALRGQQARDLLPLLHELGRVPVAVVHGRHDPARTLEHARQMQDAIPGASLHVLDTGHTSCAEAPEAFARIVREVAARAMPVH